MSAAVQLRFDYSALDGDTRRFVQERAERIHNLARMTAASIVQIGQYLTEAKERLEHGQFVDWIDKEFSWKRTTAWRFMEVHEKVKCSNLEHLQIDVSALYLIAAPSTPEPVRTEALRRAENGEHVSNMGARELVRRFAETGELPEVKTSLGDILQQRRNAIADTKVDESRDREAERRLREQVKTNSAHALLVMNVIRAIESFNTTPLTVPQMAAEIRRLDTPDKDWHGQTDRAATMLAKLCAELKRL